MALPMFRAGVADAWKNENDCVHGFHFMPHNVQAQRHALACPLERLVGRFIVSPRNFPLLP